MQKQTEKRKFTLEYWIDEGWYVGKLREVPGVFSQGRTLKSLLKNISDAYEMMIEENTITAHTRSVKTKEVGIPV